MQFVFNVPMLSGDREQPFRSGVSAIQTGNAADGLNGCFTLNGPLAFDTTDLF
jgi:hypothetical protein